MITAKQRDAAITVSVTGHKSQHATIENSSKPTQRVLMTTAPRIAGSARVGETLTARVGTWSSGTSFSYAWFADGKRISGATGSTYRPGAAQVGKRITVAVTGRLSGYTTVPRSSGATSAVTYPARTSPVDVWTCPAWAPIKGNINDKNKTMIYHVPGGRYYDATKPEECFRTTSAAVNAGYRASKNG